MHCPRCGYDGVPAAESCNTAVEGSFVTIARFAWASEAGYFSHELGVRNPFETRILWEDLSDKVHGFWQGEYLLQVPPEWADEARAQLRLLLDDKGDGTADAGRWDESSDREQAFDPQLSSSIRWVPIVLTLTAGTVVAIGYQVWLRHEVRPPIARDQTLEELDAPREGGQLFVHQEADGTSLTIELNPAREQMILTEDLDGDGEPDQRRVLQVVH